MTNAPTPRMIKAGCAVLKSRNQFVSPDDFITAIYEAMERARTEPERPEGFYWVKHLYNSDASTVLYWNGSDWRDGDKTYAPTVTPISDRLTPPEPNAWIEWNGGECPVPPETLIRIKMRVTGEFPGATRAGRLDWRHADIIAYKVEKQP